MVRHRIPLFVSLGPVLAAPLLVTAISRPPDSGAVYSVAGLRSHNAATGQLPARLLLGAVNRGRPPVSS